MGSRAALALVGAVVLATTWAGAVGAAPDPQPALVPELRHPAATDGTRWAFAAARRFHEGRGLRVRARVGDARTDAEWRRVLGTAAAGRFAGYASFSGHVLLGPAVTAGLSELHRARGASRAAGDRQLPDGVGLDRMTVALAVVLHETLHASGAQWAADYRASASGRGLEEGVTEAATVDLLPGFVRALRVDRRLETALLGAVPRYAIAYPGAVGMVRWLSGVATGAAPGSARARSWRVGVADRWGADRWSRLAAATGRSEEALRALLRDPPAARLIGGPARE